MKVLVADKFEKSGLDGLKELGCDVVFQPDLKDDALTEAIGSSGAEVLIVRSTKVTRAMLEAGHLSLVIRAGAGYNTIDVEAASERGIYVANCPGQELGRCRGACLRLDPRARPARRGQRRGLEARSLEQEGVQQGPRSLRTHAGPDRRRRHRQGDDSSRPGLRHAGRRVEPEPDARARAGPGRRTQGFAARRSPRRPTS